MPERDDCTLTPTQLKRVRREAAKVLEQSGAMGRFPTPVAAILDEAQVEVVAVDAVEESFLRRLRRKAGEALLRGWGKIVGVLDAAAKLAYIDNSLLVVKKTFLKLHETGHAYMPWQREAYKVVEECDESLSPDVSELFDREASVFASEVLFQLDTFTEEATDHDFNVKVPLKLSKNYGASLYATIRRYVSTNPRPCAVLVLNPPELVDGSGFQATLRRVVVSAAFAERFGTLQWPDPVVAGTTLGRMVPQGKKRMSGRQALVLTDVNGDRHECIGEAFNSTRQVFILICPVACLDKTSIVLV